MPVAMYLRKSRAEELSDTTAEVLARHREILTDLAIKKNIIITDVFEEVVSGESIEKRPEMKKLLDAVRCGEYSAVVCMDIDRLGRGNMRDQGIIIEVFQESGTKIITPDKTYDLNDDIDEELTEFKAFFARREWKAIRKRMRRGLMQTVQNGGYVANAPYGYKKVYIGKAPNDMPTLEIIPEEAKFIRHIYSRYLEGVGANIIVQELNAMGSVPHRQSEWNKSSIRNILRNPTYKGYVAWNRVHHYKPGTHGNDKHHVKYMPEDEWLLYKGLHEAIISEEDWEKAQHIRQSRYIPSQKTDKLVNPFAGVMFCGRCGKRMQRFGANQGVPYITCPTKGCCASAKQEYVEEAFLISISEMLEKLKIKVAENAAPDLSAELDIIEQISKELKKIDTRLPRLYEFLEDGTYDRETFKARMEAAEAEREKLLREKNAAETRLQHKRSLDNSAAIAELESILSLWPSIDADQRNKLLKAVISKIYYYKDKKTKMRDFSLIIEPAHFIL